MVAAYSSPAPARSAPTRDPRSLSRIVALGIAVALAACTTPAGVAYAADADCADNVDGTKTCVQTFDYTGQEQTFDIPAGVTTLDLVVTGADGESIYPAVGGLGGVATITDWPVPAGVSRLYVEVGGVGGPSGGFNGGASNKYGGGGGGASDIRTIPRSDTGTLETRVIVAGGGGGAGESVTYPDSAVSGAGGNAGSAGASGFGGDASSMGAGGGGGTDTAGGVGGTGAILQYNGSGGTLGVGGAGGIGNATAGNGGGGYYGGGGGGAGGLSAPYYFYNPSGGGGGGSSYAPGGTTGVRSPGIMYIWDTPRAGSVTISWTVVPFQYPGFTGFSQPVDAAPVINTVKAGQAVPVKFTLGGDFGLDIFGPGGPKLLPSDACEQADEADSSLTTVASSKSGLTYDPPTETYTYVWKTTKGDKGCGEFFLNLKDGSTHSFIVNLT